VTAETCRVAYRGAGAPAAPVEAERKPARPDEAGRGRARKRSHQGDLATRKSSSASRREDGARARKARKTES
jgi:hypothetical protein